VMGLAMAAAAVFTALGIRSRPPPAVS
jgi:hypothetical protein